jgi:hypothetical protein
MQVLAYLFYGEKKEYKLELFYSVLSALKQLRISGDENIKICVISDRPGFDPDLPLDFLYFSPEEYQRWTQCTNGTEYNHKVKIHALIKLLEHYQCPVALIDTDTYFLDNPDRIFQAISPQQTVMHCLEYQHLIDHALWEPMMAKIGDGIEIDGLRVTPQSSMFNSGVIGVEPCHIPLLEKALAVVDDLYARSPIFNIEQFAVGVSLQSGTQVATCEPLLEHYYGGIRSFVHFQIAQIFPDFTAATLEKLLTAPIPTKIDYPSKTIPDQVITKVLAAVRRWNPDYRFAYLSYRSAFSNATKDPECASLWSDTALQMLKSSQMIYGGLTVQHLDRDFRQFSADQIESWSWLKQEVKNNWLLFWNSLPCSTS